jgi:hypothetical protein
MTRDGTPVRLRLSRRKGFDLQALSRATNGLPAVNVARPSRFGNPFMEGAVELFRGYARSIRADFPHAFDTLAGRNLACWCAPDAPCHADVLLDLANAPASADVEETVP